MKRKSSSNLENNSAEAMIKRMTLIHFAILAGILVFAGISIALVQTGKEVTPDLHESFQLVVPLVAVVSVFSSRFVYTFLIKKAASESGEVIVSRYQTAILVRLAILEAPCLFATVAHLLTGNYFYLIILTALVILIILFKPSLYRFREEMDSTSL